MLVELRVRYHHLCPLSIPLAISELDIVNTSDFDTYAIQCTNVNCAAQQRHSPASTRLALYSKVAAVDAASLPTSSVCTAALSASTHVTC
jgi:hypothetical protein